jgi:GNAT superfamily N-acetyltransferase
MTDPAPELQIRDARRDDEESILGVTLSGYQEYAKPMAGMWEAYRQNIVETLANPAPAEQIVAERSGTIVGAVLLYPAGGVIGTDPQGTPIRLTWPEVRLLAVPPDYRGQGVGAALMDECIRRARAARATALTLHTSDMMQAAMRMYGRLGFARYPEIDFHPAPEVTIKGYRLELKT